MKDVLSIVSVCLFACAAGCQDNACGPGNDCGPGWTCLDGVCAPAGGADARLSDTEEDLPRDCVAPAQGQLLLNELLADPSGADINGDGVADSFQDEFVEILNVGGTPADITGLSVRVGSKVRYVFGRHCLPPGDAAVVFGGGTPAPRTGALVVASQGLRLTNSGSSVALMPGGDGPALDLVQYGAEADGPHSITRVPDGHGAWQVHPSFAEAGRVVHSAGFCVNGGGFPGCAPPPAPAPDVRPEPECPPADVGEIVVNEVLADSGGLDANGDGFPIWQDDEFVEILLVASGRRDLADVTLEVAGHPRATLPGGCRAPGAAFVYFGGGVPKLDVGAGTEVLVADKTLTLSNAGGVVALWRGEEVLDAMVYGPEGGQGMSLTRFPDGSGPFVPHGETPRGAKASPGRRVDGATFAEGFWESPEGELVDPE